MKKFSVVLLTISFLLLTACAKREVGVVCPEFGAHCTKKPINSWSAS